MRFLSLIFLATLLNCQAKLENSTSLKTDLTFIDLDENARGMLTTELTHLLTHEYAELNNSSVTFTIGSIRGKEYFFNSLPTWKSLAGLNHYRLNVNPQIFDWKIPPAALRGIMAHELEHSLDYHQGFTIPDIMLIGLQTLSESGNMFYERKTDFKTVLRGYGAELIKFKQWQYPLLEEAALKKKKQEYLTPEEIHVLLSLKRNSPEKLTEILADGVPLSLEELMDRIHR